MMKIKTFTVTGRGTFPVDMLRYDSCWPTDTESAACILVSPDDYEEWSRVRTVNLATYAPAITRHRWSSFSWVVK
jgi:hypothetical protein